MLGSKGDEFVFYAGKKITHERLHAKPDVFGDVCMEQHSHRIMLVLQLEYYFQGVSLHEIYERFCNSP